MDSRFPFESESSFIAWLDGESQVRPPDALMSQVLARTAATRRRPGWAVLERWFPMHLTARFGAVPRAVMLLIILALALVLATAGAVGTFSIAIDDPYPPGPGTFSASSLLIQPRTYPTTLRLRDGTVAVVGGAYADADPVLSIELRDPRTGTYRAADAVGTVPAGLAVLLDDGLILVVGREASEVFDLATETFSATGPMSLPFRADPTVVALGDGRALVSGGWVEVDGQTTVLDSVDIFDPETGLFVATGPMLHARGGHTATLLPDGRVLIAGGGPIPDREAEAEIWDPDTDTFSPAGILHVPRSGHQAVLQRDGTVLLIGGQTAGFGGAGAAEAEVWDATLSDFTRAGALAQPRLSSHTATLLPDDRVLVTGGFATGNYQQPIGPSEIWDPSTMAFSPGATLLQARGAHAAVLLDDGTVLVAGGWEGESPPPVMASEEIWTPGSGS